MLQRLRDFIKTTRMNVSLIVIVATVYIIDYLLNTDKSVRYADFVEYV